MQYIVCECVCVCVWWVLCGLSITNLHSPATVATTIGGLVFCCHGNNGIAFRALASVNRASTKKRKRKKPWVCIDGGPATTTTKVTVYVPAHDVPAKRSGPRAVVGAEAPGACLDLVPLPPPPPPHLPLPSWTSDSAAWPPACSTRLESAVPMESMYVHICSGGGGQAVKLVSSLL